MIKKLLHSKIFVLFLSMILFGFIIGYVYSTSTSKTPKEDNINTLENLAKENNLVGSDLPEPEIE